MAVSQRSRIVSATVELVGRDGFHPVSVSEIVARAGVSRKSFYVHFEDGKEEALAAGYEQEMGVLVDKIARRSAGVPLDTAGQRLRLRLTLLLDALASDPTVAKMLFVEVLAAGQLALEHRDRGVLRLARALLHDHNDDGGGRELPLLERAATGGLWEVLHHEIAAGNVEGLPALAGELHTALVEIVDRDRS